MSPRTPAAEAALAGDYLLAAYLATTGLLAAATATPAGAGIAAAHAAAVAGLWAWSRRGRRSPAGGRGGAGESRGGGAGEDRAGRPPAGGPDPDAAAGPGGGDRRPGGARGPGGARPDLSPREHVLRFLRIFLPVVVTPLLYTELQTLNQLVSPGYLDGAVRSWEAAVFGEQVSLTAARRLPSLWLSEALHLGYFSYYFVVPGAAVAVYRNRGGRALARLTVTVALAFFLCYLCFAVFPVAGPRYEFPRITGPVSEGPFFGLVHGVLEVGSSKGTAFPSSHVAAAAAALLACRRGARRWFWAFLPAVALLTLGTVYGRFHYAVDAAAGLAVAFAAYAATPALERWPRR